MADTQSLTATLYVQAQRALDDPFSLTSALIVVIFFLVSSSAIQSCNKRRRLIPGVPIVGIDERGSVKAAKKRFVHDAKGLLQEGYEMAGGGLFYVPSPLGERLMLSREYAEELKSAPVDKVDFVATFQEMFEGKYTTMGSRSTLHPRVVKAQVNQHLYDLMPAIEEEIQDSFEAIWPKCDDWTEVAVAEKFTQLVGRVSSRMFGGKQLSQNTEWVNTTITFAVDGFIGAQKIKKYPRILRPLAARFIPEIAKIKNHYKFARNLLIPIMQERKRTGEKPMDLLQWMMDNAKGPEETDEAFIADIMLKVSFAAIHTSAAAPTQLIYDLCQIPEIVAPLREEMQAAFRETGGRWNKQTFNKMPKMDSFLKESQRFNPLLLITMERLIHTPLTLHPPSSPPLTIPANTTIGVPTQALSMDPSIYPSPSLQPPHANSHPPIQPPPNEFHPFRFAALRASCPNQQEAGKYTYASSNPQSMAFGYGRHACPGRGFASCEIKAILGFVVRGFEVRGVGNVEVRGCGEDGGEGRGKWKRPESVGVETQLLPDQGGRVMMKRRTQGVAG